MFNDLTSSISEQEVRKKTQKVVQLVEISAVLNSTLKPDILLRILLIQLLIFWNAEECPSCCMMNGKRS